MVIFQAWLDSLKDRQAQARMAARLDRLAAGNFGDCKPVGRGVSELRIDHGPGYRVYFGTVRGSDPIVVLLLCAGDKRRQSADIAKAIAYFNDYKQRSSQNEKPR